MRSSLIFLASPLCLSVGKSSFSPPILSFSRETSFVVEEEEEEVFVDEGAEEVVSSVSVSGLTFPTSLLTVPVVVFVFVVVVVVVVFFDVCPPSRSPCRCVPAVIEEK